jgi:hypothetical protein
VPKGVIKLTFFLILFVYPDPMLAREAI